MSTQSPPSNGNGKTVWSFLTGAVPLVVTAFGGLWAVLTMQMTGELGPVKTEQGISRTERGENKQDIIRERELRLADNSKVQDELREVRETVVSLKAALVEVETQFRSQSISTNLMRADQLRTNAILWEGTFPGSRYPSDAQYYPSISQPK